MRTFGLVPAASPATRQPSARPPKGNKLLDVSLAHCSCASTGNTTSLCFVHCPLSALLVPHLLSFSMDVTTEMNGLMQTDDNEGDDNYDVRGNDGTASDIGSPTTNAKRGRRKRKKSALRAATTNPGSDNDDDGEGTRNSTLSEQSKQSNTSCCKPVQGSVQSNLWIWARHYRNSSTRSGRAARPTLCTHAIMPYY